MKPGARSTPLRPRPAASALALALALTLALALGAPLIGQIQSGFKGGDSIYPEYYELPATPGARTNRLRGVVRGQEWQHLSNRVFRVSRMRIEHYEWDGQTNLVAEAPECLFDARTRLAWSTGRLDIVGLAGGLVVQGKEGFQVQMTNSVLIVSNRVRTVIQRELLSDTRP